MPSIQAYKICVSCTFCLIIVELLVWVFGSGVIDHGFGSKASLHWWQPGTEIMINNRVVASGHSDQCGFDLEMDEYSCVVTVKLFNQYMVW